MPAFSTAGGLLTFNFDNLPTIPAEQQIALEITVVLNDTPVNVPGTIFTNTAKWSFGRKIGDDFYEPLPGEWGISEPMTIVGPELVVTKTSNETALNLGDQVTFTIEVQNTGGGTAWETTILDNIPAGMCDYDPTTGPGVSAQILAADGFTLLRPLEAGTDFSVSYSGAPTCQLSLSMNSEDAAIGPSEHLVINYLSQLNADIIQDGLALTNIAGATQWFSADSSFSGRRQFDRTLTDGTPDEVDFQDSATVTTALAGYYFQKTVANVTSGADPATTAAPGDRLRYKLRLFNVDQEIEEITISDPLDQTRFDLTSFTMITPPPAGATYSFNDNTGLLEITGDGASLNVPIGGELVVEFEITLLSSLTNEIEVKNQATLTATDLSALSDDPYVGGISTPGEDADATTVTIRTPGPLSKTKSAPPMSATIGEQFDYRITVPEEPVGVPLYDVRILDNLSLSGADLTFIGANVISGGSWTLSNAGDATNLIIEDAATGIDIPANGQAVIEITVEVQNTAVNQSTLEPFVNSASYTYNRMNGNTASQTAGEEGSTNPMLVVEPDLTAAKTVSFVTPVGKLPTDPATVGDVLEYRITIPNDGDSTAFDTNIVDALPENLALVNGSAAAQINGINVLAFVSTPTTLPSGALAWGRQNGDFTLDIPAGQTLVLAYQVTVVSATAASIDNSVYVDWTSLDGGSLAERTGGNCPNFDTLNDYCFGPATVNVTTVDNTSISKSVVGDSFAEAPPSTTHPILRVGDTITYNLTLNLQEYTTGNVAVEDDLPAGMALENFTIINEADFDYTMQAQPASGDTGTLRWELGDISNAPSNDGTPIDTLVIQYVAKIVTDAPPVGVNYDISILRDNLARLFYTGGTPDVYPDRLTATTTIDVRQPQMSVISKTDQGTGRTGSGTAADPYQVNIATDVMSFRLSTCNAGLAPAYGVVVTDLLSPEFDETDLVTTPPVVTLGTTTLSAGSDYLFSAPAVRGGEMRVELQDSAPVNPGECLTVEYDIGFYADLNEVSKSWSNQAQLVEYRSLPLSEEGRIYTSPDQAKVWMTNLVSEEQLLVTLVSPAEATIGDEVVYEIRVPVVPMNTALENVVVTDTLHDAMTYVGAEAVDANGAGVVLTDNSVAQNVSLGIANIPAGEQVIITLTTRVANNEFANAGESITNAASYTCTNLPPDLNTASSSAPLIIVEPSLSIAKTMANLDDPGAQPSAGDRLRYSLSFTAGGGSAGDNFSDAFDLLVEDVLSLGLLYQGGTAAVNGAGNTVADPVVTGDGSTTAQRLTWSLSDTNADIDVIEGTVVTVTYDVLVLGSVQPGQDLTNSATVEWTGLDGESEYERNGTRIPEVNDYFAGPVTLTMSAQLEVSFVKSVLNVTTGEDPGENAEPGDLLRYTLLLTNRSIVSLTNTTVVDELAGQFVPGSLQLVSVSDINANTTNTDATGGANGTGIIDIRNLTLDALGNYSDSVTIVFEARLAPVIQSGTIVLNQAQLTVDNQPLATSNETSTLISSTPNFEVWKTSQDITNDPDELMAGDTLRYTITVKNIGNENAVNTILQDQIPTYTTYVAGTTLLNGAPVPDPAPGVSALQSGFLINAPGDNTAGYMRADTTDATDNVATVTFEVVIDRTVVDGTIIANQGYVNADGAGSGPIPQEPSDDPATPIPDDPTLDVVGNVPLVDAHKTVENLTKNSSVAIVDPGDVLRYTITISNRGAAPATGVVFTDEVPANTTYVDDTVELNGIPVGQPDGGISPLVSGIDVSSSDLTPPLPAVVEGTLSVGATAVVTFDVEVGADVPTGTIISNQGYVSSDGQLDEPTDADGIDSNGDQPTQVVVGDAQVLNILKEVFVIGGGAAVPGSYLEYVIKVTNIGSLPATHVLVTDDLGPLAGLVTYVAGSGTLNGSSAAVNYAGMVLSANYAAQFGNLPPGGEAELRFRVQIDPAVAFGTTLTNTGAVSWDDPEQSETAIATIDVGGTPSGAAFSGTVWHDANLNKLDELTESHFGGWIVELHRDDRLLATGLTEADGTYQFTGVIPNSGTSASYELRFRAADAGPNTPSLGYADSAFTNGPQRISGIMAAPGSYIRNLNLPIWPNGAVYNSVARIPVAGAQIAMLNATTGEALPARCFDDPVQQNQVTGTAGFYKFDLNFSDAACPAGGTYLIEVTPPATGYRPAPSLIIPPASDATTAAFSVPACPFSTADAVPTTAEYCEVVSIATVPPLSVPPGTAGTIYYLHLLLSDVDMPGQSQIFNNPIPIDPELDGAVAITKTTPQINVTRGSLVPYTITVTNVLGVPLYDISIADYFPAGFKYVAGSARLDGNPAEPQINGLELVWDDLSLQVNQKYTLQLLLVVGSGVSEGEYVNRALVRNNAIGAAVSGEATATVQVVPDPDFDCTDVIGKVFDDRNLNGQQDQGEKGLAGVRVVTVRGLIATTDMHGRFHITCAMVPDEDRGSNFILKLDERSLPTGYRLTTENPRVLRATRGKMIRFKFGATIHRVVRIDFADGVFEPDTSKMRPQWVPRIEQLLEELKKAPSVLRLSYLADVERKGLVKKRLDAMKKMITRRWEQSNVGYHLAVETEIFWRRGAPVAGR